jgi:hypothetical protein
MVSSLFRVNWDQEKLELMLTPLSPRRRSIALTPKKKKKKERKKESDTRIPTRRG